MRKTKKFLPVLLAICMVVTLLSAPAQSATFDDVDGHWGEAAIERWAGYNVLNGKGDGKFDPDTTMTRAEFATMLVNMMGYTETSSETFTDLDPSQWYADAVSKLVAAGVMRGVGNGRVDPTGEITREEAAVMLCRAFGITPSGSGSLSFADSDNVSPWAMDAMTALAERGMINGVGGNMLSPDGIVNRATAAQLASNMVAVYANEDTVLSSLDTNGVVIVVKGAKVEIADSTITAPIVVQSAEVTLTNTQAADVKAAGEKSSIVADEQSSVANVVLAGEAPTVEIKGAVAGTVTVEEGATGATATVPQGTSVANESGSAVSVNGSSVASGSTAAAPAAPSTSGGGSVGSGVVVGGGSSGSGSGTAKPPAGSAGETPVTKPEDPEIPSGSLTPNQSGKPADTTPTTEEEQAKITEDHTVHSYERVDAECVTATCSVFGKTVERCSCGLEKVTNIDKVNHTASETANASDSVAPTCATKGYDSFDCSVCGAKGVKVTQIAATGEHTYSDGWTSDESQHWHQCKVCGDKKEAANHTGTKWVSISDTQHQGVCEICNKSMTANHGTLVEVENTAKTATCEADGKAADKKCPNCNYVETGKTIEKTGHTAAKDWSKDDKQHWHVCATCGKVADTKTNHDYDEETNVCECGAKKPCAEHQYDEGKVTTAATCTQAGVKTFTCEVCGATKTGTIEALKHDWSGDFTSTNDTTHTKTCARDGCNETQTGTHDLTTADCDVCGGKHTHSYNETTGLCKCGASDPTKKDEELEP